LATAALGRCLMISWLHTSPLFQVALSKKRAQSQWLYRHFLVGGFNMLSHPSKKYEFVSWDDDIPNRWKVKFMFQTTNQLINHYLPLSLLTIINHL
jgi:hypothetical protein